MSQDDLLLERLTYRSGDAGKLSAIPWPEGLAPVPAASVVTSEDSPLPQADILVVTWTSAESQALADVLTPGRSVDDWLKYTEHYAEYEPRLTWKSPAKESRCLGISWPTRIGNKTVLCFKSDLHLATDDDTAPIISLWKQIIAEVQPQLVITTGTAGGIGEATVLGDVFVVDSAKFNCTKVFRSESWAQQRYESAPFTPGSLISWAETIALRVNADRLKPVATRDPIIVCGGDVETVDYFGFDDTDDSYGIVKDDPQAHTEEMDDATLWLAISQMNLDIKALSIRNASDPEVPSSIGTLEEQSKWASDIYTKFGYWTTVGSAITCWAVIADQ